MPTISPARSSRLISSSRRTPRSVDQAEMLGLQPHLAGLRRRLVELQAHLAADHQLGQLLGDRSRAVARSATIAPWRMT